MKCGSAPASMLTIVRVTAFMTLVLLAFVAQRPAIMVAGSFLCAIYVLVIYWSARITWAGLLVTACVCALFIPAFIKPYQGLSPVFYLFSTVSVFFAAKAMSRHPPEVFLGAFRLMFAAAVLAIAWVLYTYWEHPEPFGEVIEGSSTNGIPAYLIVIQVSLSLSNYLVRRQLPILSPILTGIVAFFGIGRGSLVVAGLIIVASLLSNLALARSTSRSRHTVNIAFVIAISILLVWQGEEWLDLLVRYTKLSEGLVDANRLEIWDDYLGQITPWTLLVGADHRGAVIEDYLRGNPHIAYIRTHSFFGLPVTLLALVSPVFVFYSRKTLSAKLIFACFISLAALRAASEPIFFPTLLDFFYFLCFFLFFRYAPSVRRGEARHLRIMVQQ